MCLKKRDCSDCKLTLLKKSLRWALLPMALCIFFIWFSVAKDNPSNWKQVTLNSYSYALYEVKGSSGPCLDITDAYGTLFRNTNRYNVSQQVLHYYFNEEKELSIMYCTWLGINYIESITCDGIVLIDINNSISSYYNDLKVSYAMAGISGGFAIIAAIIPIVLSRKKEKVASILKSYDGEDIKEEFYGNRITPIFYMHIPKQAAWFFNPCAHDHFKAIHPVAYVILSIIAMTVAFLPLLIYVVLLFVFHIYSNAWWIPGAIGAFVIGFGLMNIVAAWIHQYLGHIITMICILSGSVLVTFSFLMCFFA